MEFQVAAELSFNRFAVQRKTPSYSVKKIKTTSD
jgi:hypothetical protein